jgi:hypothetical protein
MAGFTVSLKHAATFKDQVLSDDEGWNRTKGECATGVQYVFYKAGKPLGKTNTWKQGVQVKGNKILPGTAIASFRNGKYMNDHAAVFIKETDKGLWVWDQWKGKKWGKRLLKFKAENNPYSNDGELFFVIIK